LDALAEVEGAFAIVWVSPDGTVGLARDAIGERTLYHVQVPGGVVFASTIAAVLVSGLVDRRLDVSALAAYLSCGYVPGEGTLVAGIRELLPAEIVRIHHGAVTRHHILYKVDALGAAAGVVARSPLFDRAVVEVAFAIPPQLKLRGAVEKYVLKEAVRDLLPGTILDRPKSGMLVPVEGWFEGPLLPLARERLLDGLPPGVIDRGYVERLLGGRLGGLRPRRGAKIWLLLTLESWLRGFGVSP